MKYSERLSCFFFFVFSIGIFSSCKKAQPQHGHQAPGNKPTDTTLQTIKAYSTDDFSIEFFYADQNKMTEMNLLSPYITGDAIEAYHIGYYSTGRVISLRTDSAKKILIRYIDSTLGRADMYDLDGTRSYTNYLYDNGRLAIAKIYQLPGFTDEPYYEWRYSYDQGDNISEDVELHSDGTPGRLAHAGHYINSYDSKKNIAVSEKSYRSPIHRFIHYRFIVLDKHKYDVLLPDFFQ